MPVAKNDRSLLAACNQCIDINHNEEPSRHTAHILYLSLYGFQICILHNTRILFYVLLHTGLAVSIIP